ncbi:MAG: S8 family serine peptidase [Candidatus Puniceispirillaceae bacterium]
MTRWLALLSLIAVTCAGPAAATPSREALCGWVDAAQASGDALFIVPDKASAATVRLRPPGPGWRVAMIDVTDEHDRPLMQVRAIPPCRPLEARRLVRLQDGMVGSIEVLTPDFSTVIAIEPQNPPLPRLQAGPGSATLAHVDTGVNYQLTDLQPHIATDGDGRPLGYDFWDDDNRPFDADPRGNPYFPRHHGTTVFSVLAREAPQTGIAIYRFPAPDMCRFADLIAHMAQRSVRIVSLSMGSNDRSDWACFEAAAGENPQMLFIVSAGNDGRDLDRMPIYPAALPLPNMIVVTSSDDFGRLGRGSNFGAATVDLMVPAEQVTVMDHRGAFAETGGTSYAVPRVAALAARFLDANPDANTPAIKEFLASRAITAPDVPLTFGWIPDPTDNFGF